MTTKQLTITLPELAAGERYLCGVIRAVRRLVIQ